ncbi:hypothetical protein K488DRAFT_89043 [Vararia minispora EC-137]|uniref:Uncharacterized protein n=1 Tax=Vararia minispora EC-137 TaxID=1314806 RepID=A0ACB8QBM2_9AGAM|nr:hypothetical protein K488DRAFT_89043 [Vararia minispora EC-137]
MAQTRGGGIGKAEKSIRSQRRWLDRLGIFVYLALVAAIVGEHRSSDGAGAGRDILDLQFGSDGLAHDIVKMCDDYGDSVTKKETLARSYIQRWAIEPAVKKGYVTISDDGLHVVILPALTAVLRQVFEQHGRVSNQDSYFAVVAALRERLGVVRKSPRVTRKEFENLQESHDILCASHDALQVSHDKVVQQLDDVTTRQERLDGELRALKEQQATFVTQEGRCSFEQDRQDQPLVSSDATRTHESLDDDARERDTEAQNEMNYDEREDEEAEEDRGGQSYTIRAPPDRAPPDGGPHTPICNLNSFAHPETPRLQPLLQRNTGLPTPVTSSRQDSSRAAGPSDTQRSLSRAGPSCQQDSRSDTNEDMDGVGNDDGAADEDDDDDWHARNMSRQDSVRTEQLVTEIEAQCVVLRRDLEEETAMHAQTRNILEAEVRSHVQTQLVAARLLGENVDLRDERDGLQAAVRRGLGVITGGLTYWLPGF